MPEEEIQPLKENAAVEKREQKDAKVADDAMESFKWWTPAVEYRQKHLDPIAQDPDNPLSEPLGNALKAALNRKVSMNPHGLSAACKWYHSKINGKSPQQVVEACETEKWTK